VQQAAWISREWDVARRLFEAGVAVPRPIDAEGGAILMEMFEDEDGRPAPPLQRASLSAAEAERVLERLLSEIERMLAANVVHGDLSPYNVLFARGELRVIDFPQAVDPRENGHALHLLARDVENVCRFCARAGGEAARADPGRLSRALWERFSMGAL
jgi:RIO kinase 1